MSSKPLEREDPRMKPEQAVLGCVLMDGRTYFELPPRLKATDFDFHDHRALFTAFGELVEAKIPIDLLTVSRHLAEKGKLVAAGGAAYVSALLDVVPSTANVGAYAQAVLDQSDGRKLIWRINEAAKIARQEAVPIGERKAQVEQVLTMDDSDDEPIEDERDVVKRVMSRVESSYEENSIRGFKTGIPTLDEKFFANPTDLIVLGGRPGQGKSVLASQIADNVGRTGPVLFIPLEMRSDEIVARRIMDRGSLTVDDVRNPRSNDSAARLLKACSEIYDETKVRYFRCRELATILRAATRMKRREGLKLLVIDYLQRLNLWGLPGETRDQQIGYATERLKSWADDNEVPILLLSQLSRPPKMPRVAGGKPKPAPFPSINDLRESGNIEADANGVLLLHIPGLIDGTPQAAAKDKRTTFLIVAKQRSGEGNVVVPLNAVFEHARFSEPPAEEEPAESTQAEAEASKRDSKGKATTKKQQRMDLPAEERPDYDGRDH